MSTRGRSSFCKLTLLVLLVIFALLLLLTSLHNADNQMRVQQAQLMVQVKHVQQSSVNVSKSEWTAPGVQDLKEPIDEELVKQLEHELPEVDYGFWYHYAKPQNYRKSRNCSQYPDPLDLQLHNIYWQTFSNRNVTFRLYAAYVDLRAGLKSKLGVVRILATANQIANEFPPTYCQLWYAEHKEPVITQVSEWLSVWPAAWGHPAQLSYPHLISCPVPNLPANLKESTPRTVSLVKESCESASNSLRVHYDRPPIPIPTSAPTGLPLFANATFSPSSNTFHSRNSSSTLSFGVCIKGFDFPFIDLSERLIEWFELQRLLGASRIYAYMYDVHPAVQRVLDYYQRIDFLELRPLTMANGMPRLRHYQHLLLQKRRMIKRLNELIPYNDCFYRNMHRHDYLLNVDIDEVIMPLGTLRTWHDVLEADRPNTIAKCPNGHVALCFINTYFTKVVPEAQNHEQQEADELFVLQHTMRHRNYSLPNRATKCFHNTRYSLVLHNHYTLKWLPGGCNPRTFDTKLAQMQHYREPDKKYELAELVDDRSAWKYAIELRAAVEHVVSHLDDVQEQVSLAEQVSLEEQETDLEQTQEQQQVLEQVQSAKVNN
ncbi:uncharacterized protein LOC6565480 [Drosophila grimshawi]|uniref:Glycosyltransferase family 92 protein n=1 Tax=Drosophila grimshawi TaxID=7222 RepID=B4JKT4_DROGR|nr:uncharacterized protein LOC6565480 [Drosophila grimshawi]EDW00187.1 GH12728 [Drosophila grimshawi]